MAKPEVGRFHESASCKKFFTTVREQWKSGPFSENKPEDYGCLRVWLSERDREKWDEEIERDVTAGKRDFLVKEAVAEKNQWRLKKL